MSLGNNALSLPKKLHLTIQIGVLKIQHMNLDAYDVV